MNMAEPLLTQPDAHDGAGLPESESAGTWHYDEAPDASVCDGFPAQLRDLYVPIQPIGKGTQGTVYLAKRKSDGRSVAIKEIQIRSVENWKDYDLFKRESEVLRTVKMKGVAEFIASCECLSQQNPAAYIVQEYIDGRSLDEMLHAGYRFTINRIFEIGLQILDLLEKLHHHDPPIIHRDIKPSNIMLKPTDNDRFDVYLIDFGAVANPQVQDGGSTVAGTYGYMPPEQLMGNPCASSDLYSLGALLAYMLSGVEPMDMNTSDFRLIIDPHLENVPRPVVRMLQRMLDPDAKKRLSDYGMLRDMFRAFAAGRYSDFAEETAMLPKEWNLALRDVSRYGQPGNIDLWMQLSESTNRPDIPDAYRILTRSRNISIIVSHLWWGLLYSALFIFLSFFVFSFAPRTLTMVLVIVFFSEFIYLLFGLHRGSYKSTPRYARGMVAKDLLLHGRKGIATVVDVRYCSVRDDSIVQNIGTTSGKQYYASCAASFRIRYKFNPPDDSLSEDLIHEVVTHRDLSESLAPGAPFPILYSVSDDKRKVRSMPFPLPLQDIELDRDDYCCTTQDGKMVL